MDDVRLMTFPATETEALAMLYVQNQDISKLTPEQLYDLYASAYSKIKAQRSAKRREKYQSLGN